MQNAYKNSNFNIILTKFLRLKLQTKTIENGDKSDGGGAIVGGEDAGVDYTPTT